jgi:Domain of unknown function (DUF3291)
MLFSGASPMPFVSVTRVRVRSLWYTLPFLVDAVRTSRQARAAEGNLAVKVLRDAGNTWWTCTAWDSEASMRQFMLAKPHGAAMRKLRTWCDEAAIVHWTQPDAVLPSWLEAHGRMQAEGRASKVDHPSPNHSARVIAAPIVSPKNDITFK